MFEAHAQNFCVSSMEKMKSCNPSSRNGMEHSTKNGVANSATHEKQLRSIISPLAQLITIKLEEDNYPIGKFQVENAIMGYGLKDYIYGTYATSPRLIDSNVNFVRHQKEDRLLIYWILASISTSYLRPIGWLLLFTSNMYNH